MTMALSPEQTALYVHTADVWRLGPGASGQPKAWSKVFSAIPCYFQTGLRGRAPSDWGLTQMDGREALDTLHCEASHLLQPGDYVQQLTGPFAGRWYAARVHPLVAALWANKASVLIQRDVPKAGGIP